ncbi:MAG: carboxypeptidase-like regulatory domain-containing protein, partial [Planctomycetota bacterium]|nr:carboxypeptidase-like regulatory domain-containing protein [Planctomycetota bacterium]
RTPLLVTLLGVLVLALAWVAFTPDPARPEEPGGAGVSTDGAPRPEPGALGALAPGLLAGQGPLRIELRWLGARDDARAAPQLPGRLEGQVIGPQGTPVSGALITVMGGPQDGRFTRADALGRYSLGQLLSGTHFFVVEGASFGRTVRMQRVLERAVTRRDFIVGATTEMRIIVRDHEGKTLAGARVSADRGARSGVTDEAGIALVPDVPSGPRVVVEIQADGFVPSRYELNLAAAFRGNEPVEIPPLERGGSLRVAVRSWPGGPLPRVTVVPRSTAPVGIQPAWERWQDVEVDREGFVILDGLPTTHLLDVRVMHPMGTAEPPMRALRPSAETAALAEFVVRRSSSNVGGKISDENGAPVEGAACVLSSLRPDLVLSRLYPGLGEAQTALPLPVPGALRREVRSSADGSFLFAVGDHPDGTGSLLLTVTMEGFRPARSEIRTLGQDASIRLTRASRTSALVLSRRDDGEIPSASFVLDGEEQPDAAHGELGGLWPGFYEVLVVRGELQLLHREEYWIEGRTNLDLSP